MQIVDRYQSLISNLNPGHDLTRDMVRVVVEGRTQENDASFIGIWKNIIHRLQTENDGARYTTSELYSNALKSFENILWDTTITGFKITIDDLKRWNEGMKNGVRNKEGKLIGKISDTTRGIYLRTCRAVWNEYVAQGYLSNVEYPFSKVKKGLVAIPSSGTRKNEYLTVEQMTQLYNVFINKSYPGHSRRYQEYD